MDTNRPVKKVNSLPDEKSLRQSKPFREQASGRAGLKAYDLIGPVVVGIVACQKDNLVPL